MPISAPFSGSDTNDSLENKHNLMVQKRRRAKRVGTFLTSTVVAAASAAAFFVGAHVGHGGSNTKVLTAWLSHLDKPSLVTGHEPAAMSSTDSVPPVDSLPILDDPTIADIPNPNKPLAVRSVRSHGVPMVLIDGGAAGTRRSPLRAGVDEIVARNGAKAGVNGTFFANASLTGTDNLLIGPSLCGDEGEFVFSPFDKKPELTGRPMVLLSPDRTRIYPYDPSEMSNEPGLRSRLPKLTDAFLGGVWLVHNGVATDAEEETRFHISDAQDPRRRAFFYVTNDGTPGLGATTYVAKSSDIARALPSLGIREAVLLDSGFSTSLVCGSQILVTGHTSPGIPSRPVPHAILLFASAEPTLPADVAPVQLASDEPRTRHVRRRMRHRA